MSKLYNISSWSAFASIRKILIATVWAVLIVELGGCAATPGPAMSGGSDQPAPAARHPARNAPADADEQDSGPPDWKLADKALGVQGEMKDQAYTLVVPRKDLDVYVDGMAIAPGALLSVFHIYQCPCGKLLVSGNFCVCDYEANDVMDALRSGGMHIAGISPMFVAEKPHVVAVYFHGEFHGMAATIRPIKDAFGWIGEARSAPAAPLPGKK